MSRTCSLNRTRNRLTSSKRKAPHGGPVQHRRGRGVLRKPYTSVVSVAVQMVPYTDTNGEARDRAVQLQLARIDHADEVMIRSVLRKHVEPGGFLRPNG